jgi:hypothetical protein
MQYSIENYDKPLVVLEKRYHSESSAIRAAQRLADASGDVHAVHSPFGAVVAVLSPNA